MIFDQKYFILKCGIEFMIFKNNTNFEITGQFFWGSCHKRQKPQAPTPQAPIRNRQTREVANAKGLKRSTYPT